MQLRSILFPLINAVSEVGTGSDSIRLNTESIRTDSTPVRADATPVRAFALELTKGCNLRCGYCYYAEREDAYQPATKMTPEVAERSIDLLFEEGPIDQPVHLHFFGGEPLLSFPLLRHAVDYGERRAVEHDRKITFEITTNGTRLTEEAIQFLNAHAIHVGVSFDGPPEIQDVARPSGSGSSYAKAVGGIRRLLQSRQGTELEAKTHCSVVVTRRSLDLLGIARHLEELGFRKIILTPATDLTGANYGVRPEDLPELLGEYDRLADDYEMRARHGENSSATWYPVLMGRLLSGERKTEFCEGGRDYLGVAANGDAYLCYRFYEDEEFQMGSVQNGIDRGVTERLENLPLEQKQACSVCWARYFCGGGCHHDNLVSGGGLGDPNPVSCEILRHSMDRTLQMWAKLSRDGLAPGRIGRKDNGVVKENESSTKIHDEDCFIPSSSLHFQEVDSGESVVYEPTTHEVVVLNRTASFIMDLLDGTKAVAELLDDMQKQFNAPTDVLRRDLLATLEELHSKGILILQC